MGDIQTSRAALLTVPLRESVLIKARMRNIEGGNDYSVAKPDFDMNIVFREYMINGLNRSSLCGIISLSILHYITTEYFITAQ